MPNLRLTRLLALIAAVMVAFLAAPKAHAANCYYASAQGTTGPANWNTYCWLDLASFNNKTARSSAGQNFSYTLPDGTVMSFNLKASGADLAQTASPSWTGAAVGNTAFLGIGGRPILYQTASGTTTVTISSITLTPPATGSITNFMFVAADAESSNESESLRFQTNGGTWQMLDRAGPISGSTYPTYKGIGTSTFTETGVAGTVGAYIVGTANPTQVVTRLVGGGLQGTMFAVRFASIRLDALISGARADPADQFAFSIAGTGTGSVLASGTTSGAGLGPFPAAVLSSTAALPLTVALTSGAGSVNDLSHYKAALTCSNSVSSSTPMPTNVATTSFNFGALQFGDLVSCRYTVTPFPHLQLRKALASTGRQFGGDQFSLRITNADTVVASTTTTGTGATVTNAVTPQYQASAGSTYVLSEAASGTTLLEQYSATMSCTNAASTSTTVLPGSVGGSIIPQMGDVITCVITNTRRPANAVLEVTKQSFVLNDPVNGSTNPKAIPGATVVYSITVRNSGPSAVDANTVFIVDALPNQMLVGSAATPSFTEGAPASGLSFTPSTDIRFSSAASPPTSFGGCTYTPTSAYDPSVRFVCINPKGIMAGSTGVPPSFTISFQSQIK